jgi:ectoine hydroxylase-related dioxygenase (phytanoyl-CoA dioxygenase family)
VRLIEVQHGDKARNSTSLPQLSTTVTFSVRPGTKAQSLHRDDDIYHTYHPAAMEHNSGRDTMVCLFVAGTKTRKENGATRIIPGSHLWDYSQPPPSSDDPSIECAELEPGDAFMMLGGCFHGAGANNTVDEERLVYGECITLTDTLLPVWADQNKAAFSTRGYLRQEENQYLANDIDKIKELPIWLQRYAGFGVSKPFMGWVDMEEPVRRMNPMMSESLEDEFW